MSVLTDSEIKEMIENGELQISGIPYIGPSSVDLHLDNRAKILDKNKFEKGEIMDFSKKEKSSDKFTDYDGWESIIIYPSEFYLLSSVEKIKLADDVVGFVQGRSSVARMGIQVHCAGFCDAGFEGTITFEVTNLTNYPIRIPKNTRICQIVFERSNKKADIPYGKKKDQKYQGQLGPTITDIHKDYNEKV